jgi:hypothetical protein
MRDTPRPRPGYLEPVRSSGATLLFGCSSRFSATAISRLSALPRALAGGLPSRRGFPVGPAPERSGGAPACLCRPALPAARAARQGRLDHCREEFGKPTRSGAVDGTNQFG